MADKKISFNVGNCEVGGTLEYTIFSSADPNTKIIASKTVASTTESFSDIALPGIADGTITLSVSLTDVLGNIGTTTTAQREYPVPLYTPNYSFVAMTHYGGGDLGLLNYQRELMVEVKDLNPNNTFHIKIEKPDVTGSSGPPDMPPHIFTYSGNDYTDSNGRMHNVFTHGFGGWNGTGGLDTMSYHDPTFTVWETNGDTVYDAITHVGRQYNFQDFTKDKDGNPRTPGDPYD